MKKSEIYFTAIAAVIDNDNLDMPAKVDVIKELANELRMAEIMEEKE